MRAPGWTPAEDATMRALCAPKRARPKRLRLPREELLEALPGRTWAAIRQRYGVVCPFVRASRQWTPEEDAVLFEAWQSKGAKTILELFPGRTWVAIVSHAHDIGLPSVPQGWRRFRTAHQALGCDRSEALRVVAWADAWAPLVEALCAWGCEVARLWGSTHKDYIVEDGPADGWYGGAIETRMHTTTTFARLSVDYHWMLVEDTAALEDALVRYLSWETLSMAVERLRLERQPMERAWASQTWARRDDEPRVRCPPSWWDECAAARGLQAGGRSAADHALARGLTRERVRLALRLAGVAGRGKGARGYYLDSQVDAALDAYAARPGVKRCASARYAADAKRIA